MKTKVFLLCLVFTSALQAQNTITLSKAVELALQSNFDLQIAANSAQQAENSNHPGNAGMLPSVSLTVSDNPSLNNLNQRFTNGTIIERNNVFSNSLGAGLQFSYTLFDGKKMFATRRKLEALDDAAANRLKSEIQRVITAVVFNYGNIIRMQQYLDVLSQLQDLSKQRLDIVKVREEAGLANYTDLYMAQLDLETRKQNVLNQSSQIRKAYTDLNLLMNLKADSTYATDVSGMAHKPLVKQALDSMLRNNPDYRMAEDMYKAALQTRKEAEAARLPLLRLTGAYNYNLTQSQAGFSLYNQTSGPQAGLVLSVPLFSGHVNQINIANAKLDVQNSALRREQTLQGIQGVYEQSWQDYTTARQQLDSDSVSVEIAKAYIGLMQKRFEQGQSTIIELKEAQRTYEETVFRYFGNQYMLKLAETQLLALTGQLLR